MKKLSFTSLPWDIITLFFSVYSIAALAAMTLIPISEHVTEMLQTLDFFVCGFFFIDFIYRFTSAPSKVAYMKWGWLDLLSSIPAIAALRFLRITRIFRILRIFRGIRSFKTVASLCFSNRSTGALTGITIISFLTVLFGAILVLELENSAGGNLNTGNDALWWAFVTVTTVGYGDYFPITTGGRIIAGLLMVCGIGIFGIFTAFISSLFFEESEKEDANRDEKILSAIEKLSKEVESLKDEIQKYKPH